MQPCNLVLVAAGLDWLEGLLPVAFVLIWIVSQVMNLFRNAGGKGRDQAAGQPARPMRPAPKPAGRPAGGRPVAVDEEIEAFLRRTLQGDQRQSAGSSSAQVPPTPVRKRAKPKPAKRAAEAIGGLDGHGGDVARHVAAAFAHDLAHEAPLEAMERAPVPPPVAADELLAALRSPAGLRQLILMREVLDRPTHRW